VLKKIVFHALGASADNVIMGPAIGEDAAVVEGDSRPLVIASDPVTGASKNIGIHAVHVNANDVAATGADPLYFMVTLLLKEGTTEEEIRAITSQIHEACKEVGATVVGGHTEITPGIERTMISGTMFGYTDTPIRTGGAKAGDAILLTKGAGIEGTSILAHEKEQELLPIMGPDALQRAKEYSTMLSVVPEARILRSWATALHDPTEGGVAGALNEMAIASDLGFSVDPSSVPVRNETRIICNHFGCDPLQLISSGSLLATVPQQHLAAALSKLSDAGIDAWNIGVMTTESVTLPLPDHDALWDVI
jgi:hydrogenase maturation factor